MNSSRQLAHRVRLEALPSAVKLDELLRRHDVCFFCGYTIGIAGQTKCPEYGLVPKALKP